MGGGMGGGYAQQQMYGHPQQGMYGQQPMMGQQRRQGMGAGGGAAMVSLSSFLLRDREVSLAGKLTDLLLISFQGAAGGLMGGMMLGSMMGGGFGGDDDYGGDDGGGDDGGE
jgi:hypothetical protein